MSDDSFKDYSHNIGFVVDTNDPLKQGRVQVIIPGKLEVGAWAQVCMPGSPFSNGMYVVPAVKSQVVVVFLDGEREDPCVMGGLCPPVSSVGSRADTDSADLPDMVTIENKDWVLVLGKRGTNAPYFDLRSRPREGDEEQRSLRFVMDYDQQILEIDIPQAITLKTLGLIKINGKLMNLNDRPVQEGSEPI